MSVRCLCIYGRPIHFAFHPSSPTVFRRKRRLSCYEGGSLCRWEHFLHSLGKKEHTCDNIAGLFSCLALLTCSKGVRESFGWEPAQLGQTGYPAVLFSINLLLNTLPLIHTHTHRHTHKHTLIFIHLLVSII